MALSSFISASIAKSLTAMTKDIIRVSLEKLAEAGMLSGSVDDAMALLEHVQVKEPVLDPSQLWWTGKVNPDCCKAICRAEGRMLQCPMKNTEGDYCKKCTTQITKKGSLTFGTVEDRAAEDFPGVKPYEVYAKRHGITDEMISQAEEAYGIVLVRTDKKRGRPATSKVATAAEAVDLETETAEPKKKKEKKKETRATPVSEIVTESIRPLVPVACIVTVLPLVPVAETVAETVAVTMQAFSDELKAEIPINKDKKPKKEKKEKPKKEKKEKPKKETKPDCLQTVEEDDTVETESWTHPSSGFVYNMAAGNILYTDEGELVGKWDVDAQEIVAS